jgi:hypothetical protein
MKTRLLIPATLLLTILAWMVLSWPLPMHMTRAITLSAHSTPDTGTQHMVASDSIQLLYYFELVNEWITGGTPWFYNLYEFNTGDDAERYFPGGYYVPFSLVYSAVKSLSNQALGMNAAGIFSLWATIFATWLLLRRYTKDEWIVGLFSVFVVFFPYRWITLFDSSPTGFAMMWVPVLILGLDLAVRDGRALGGAMAGIAVLFAYLCDTHVFFFSVLAIPAWCFLALLAAPGCFEKGWRRILHIAYALVPLAVTGGLVVLAVRSQARFLSETSMAHGRSIGEVLLFSPQSSGFFTWQHSISSQVYLGWTIVALILLGALALTWAFLRQPRERFRPLLFMGILCMGILITAELALGPHGLRSGGLFMLVRELIPPYAMIRQPAKIFSLMPTLLAVAGTIALTALIKAGSNKAWWRVTCLTLFTVLMLWEYSSLSTPGLTYLQNEQPAYRAVAEDAQELGMEPRALVIVLWPGDSHYASIYQHFSILYRIRMINGYTPAVSKGYVDNVFLPFESINQGYLSSSQADDLLSRGIRHLLLHEDLYSEKVAPFPVSYALKHYLEHPRLRFLKQSDSVWAFRILETSEERIEHEDIETTKHWVSFFPARHWEMERSVQEKAVVLDDVSASEGRLLLLAEEGASVRLASTGSPPAPGLRWMIRCRGEGILGAEVFAGDHLLKQKILAVEYQDWQWLEIPADISTFSSLSLRLKNIAGRVELDSALLFAGDWELPLPGESMTIPALSLFHAGYTNLHLNSVMFLTKHYGKRIIFYGPKMPMVPGRYEVRLVYEADADPGTELGVMHIELGWNTGKERIIPLRQGAPMEFDLELSDNLPLNMYFVFSGKADLTVNKLEITRIE